MFSNVRFSFNKLDVRLNCTLHLQLYLKTFLPLMNISAKVLLINIYTASSTFLFEQ